MQVIIMRGIPGSGKSSWVESLRQSIIEKYKEIYIVSADHFHTKSDGTYQFDPTKAGEAHGYCLSKYLAELQINNFAFLIVDNTNTTAWEIAPYYQLAEVYKFPVKIVQVQCPFGLACQRNQHNVPHAKIWNMLQNTLTERLPSHWNIEFVEGF